MAENDIVRGLFGPTPYEVEQQQREKAYADSRAYGMMTHQARNIANERNTGYEIGKTLGKMVGYVDPERQKAEQEQSILSRYDTSTTEGMAQASQAAKAMGRYDLVAKIQQYHTGIQKQQDAHETAQANINKATANAEKMRRLQELSTKPGWDTWVKQANLQFPNPEDKAQRDDLIFELSMRGTKNQNRQVVTTFTPDGRQIKTVVDLDTTEKTDIGSAKGDEHKAFDQGVPGSNPPLVQHMVWNSTAGMYEAVGEPKPAHSGVTVNLPPQEKAFEGKLGEGQAAELIKGRASADDAVQIIKTAQTGRAILDKGMVTGFGANFIVGAGQALKLAGIDFGGDATSNSQAYAANMAQNVGKIIKQFGSGTGLSDADREYATKMAAGLITLDEKSLRKILDINETQARWVINQHNGRAKGIKSNIPLTVEMPESSAKTVIREVKLKDGRIGVEYSDGTKGYK